MFQGTNSFAIFCRVIMPPKGSGSALCPQPVAPQTTQVLRIDASLLFRKRIMKSMTEREYIDRLRTCLPNGRVAGDEVLQLVSEAIKAFPESATLWFMHGQILTCAVEHDVADTAVRSFEKCIQIRPDFADAYEHLGYHYGGVRDDPGKATEFYTKAAQLRASARPTSIAT